MPEPMLRLPPVPEATQQLTELPERRKERERQDAAATRHALPALMRTQNDAYLIRAIASANKL